MMKKIGILAGVGAAVVAVLVLAGSAFAQDGRLSVSDGSAEVGGSGTIALEVAAVGGEGLGAWTIDVTYDTAIVSATGCTAEQGGVCNEAYETDTVRITGASAGGLEGDVALGSITFTCVTEGATDLTIAPTVYADATPGNPAIIIPAVSNSTFTCGETTDVVVVTAAPSTGTGYSSGGSSTSWLVALLAVIGVAVMATGYGVVRLRE